MGSSCGCICLVDEFGEDVEYLCRITRSLSGLRDVLFSKTVSDAGVPLGPEDESNIESRLIDTGLRAIFFLMGDRALSMDGGGTGLSTVRIRAAPGKSGLAELLRLNRKFSLALFAA